MLNLSLPDYTSNLHVMQNRLICQQDGGKNCFKQSFFYSWYRIGVTESLTLNDFLPLACVVNNSSQREHFGWSSRGGWSGERMLFVSKIQIVIYSYTLHNKFASVVKYVLF